MKKILAFVLAAVLTVALCVTAFAASHAPAFKKGDTLIDENFESGDLNTDLFKAWSGYKVEDGKIHLGHSNNWVESSPEFHTAAAYSDYYAAFKIAGAIRDCYYGFGLRAPEGEHGSLMNGGRFGVPSASETSTGIAIDLYGAANSTLGEQIGITFCNGDANGDAPAFTVSRPAGFGDGSEASFEVIDLGSIITIKINGKELVTIELGELSDGVYTKATAFDASGSELGTFDVRVLAEGSIVFYQRNNYITVDDFKLVSASLDDGQQDGGEQGGESGGSENPGSGDAAIIAIAAVGCIALAGVVAAKKVR